MNEDTEVTPDVLGAIARVERASAGLMGAVQAARDAGLSPAAIGSLAGLKTTTVWQLMGEWGIS